MGCSVSRYSTGAIAKALTATCLQYLQSHTPGKQDQYQHGLAMQLLMWDDNFLSSLPGCTFVEETLEGSLSRLAHLATPGGRGSDPVTLAALYISMGPPSNKPRACTKQGFSTNFLGKIKTRLSDFISILKAGQVLYIAPPPGTPRCKAKFSVVQSWPKGLPKPVHRLLIPPLSQMQWKALLYQSITQILKPKIKDDSHHLVACTTFAPRLTMEEVASRHRAIALAILLMKKRIANLTQPTPNLHPQTQSAPLPTAYLTDAPSTQSSARYTTPSPSSSCSSSSSPLTSSPSTLSNDSRLPPSSLTSSGSHRSYGDTSGGSSSH